MDRSQPLSNSNLVDTFGRRIDYLRLSVTDRCDLRCIYCMSERPKFLPKSDVLSLEELTAICDAYIHLGVSKIRITGGEPLVRRDVMALIENLGARLGVAGLREIAVTTNGTQLDRYADRLAVAGVRRLNVSLDTICRDRFARLARRDALDRVLAGLDAAAEAGLQIKINAVALKGENENELPGLIAWAHGRGFDVSLIEIMPMGETGVSRAEQFLPLTEVREKLAARWSLEDIPDTTGGPSRYVRVAETGGRLGFISPLTQNFCAGCNRVRVTCAGELFGCLGRSGSTDLKAALRTGGLPALYAAIPAAIRHKPKAHAFENESREGGVLGRLMSHTGG